MRVVPIEHTDEVVADGRARVRHDDLPSLWCP
jgi:hypothetical protein